MCFNLYLEDAKQESVGKMAWVGVNISGKHKNNLRFTYNIVLIAASPECLQCNVPDIQEVSTGNQYEDDKCDGHNDRTDATEIVSWTTCEASAANSTIWLHG